MAVQEDYEDLDQNQEDIEDRGDLIEDDEELDEEVDDSEETDDDESDEEDTDEDEEEEEVEEPSKNIKVPKSRLDEVIRQREEAKERSAWLEAQLEKLIAKETTTKPIEQKPSYNYDEAEEQYIQLIIEGETAKATKLRNEINSHRQEDLKSLIAEVTKETTSKVKSESSLLLEEERFGTLVESFENKYKFLNADSKEYNEEAVDTVNTLLSGYIAAGKTKSEALKLAVNKVAPLYTKVVDTKQTLGNKRKVEAGKKAVEASKSQPAKTKTVSTKEVDTSKIDISKMSERDFAKLTEKEKRILRGD